MSLGTGILVQEADDLNGGVPLVLISPLYYDGICVGLTIVFGGNREWCSFMAKVTCFIDLL